MATDLFKILTATITIKHAYRLYSTIEKIINDNLNEKGGDCLLPNRELTQLIGEIWQRGVQYRNLGEGNFPVSINLTYIPTGHGSGKLINWNFVNEREAKPGKEIIKVA